MKKYDNKMKAVAFSYLGLILTLLWIIFSS